MSQKPRKTPEERRQNAREQLARWKRPIDTLTAWTEYQRLEEMAR